MFSIILILLFGGLVFAASVGLQGSDADQRVPLLVLGSYALRLVMSPGAHTASLFTTGAAVDSSSYERIAATIAHMWLFKGVHYVGGEEMPGLEHMSLPVNIFALVDYLNGEPAHWGCIAVVAVVAAFTCLDVYLVCFELGPARDVALGITALIAVLPSFLYYTSDTYKDGFVALFVIGILGCSVRLAHKFSVIQLSLAAVFLGGLWLTRFYLVFVMPAPLLLGLLGLRSGSVMRILLALLVVGTSVTVAYAYSDVPTAITHHAVRTFQDATSQVNLNENADSASGVSFDEDAPLGAFFPKLAYTLFAPFPWQSGSIGLQIGKLDAVVWYYFFYRAFRAARATWRERPSDLLIFITFVIPMTVAYAFSFANIGLIVRERMCIVLATIVFASVSWSASSAGVVKAFPGASASPSRARRVA